MGRATTRGVVVHHSGERGDSHRGRDGQEGEAIEPTLVAQFVLSVDAYPVAGLTGSASTHPGLR